MYRRYFSNLFYVLRISLIYFVILQFLSGCTKDIDKQVIPVDFRWNEPVIDGVVNFKVNTSYGKADNLSWEWDFGDSSSDPLAKNLKEPSHAFSKPGSFIVTLKVRDNVEKKEQTIIKQIFVRYFSDRPYAEIKSVDVAAFGATISYELHEGTKYEYDEPDPSFFVELSLSPSFETLVPMDKQKNVSIKLLNLVSFSKMSVLGLSPETTYYARIRSVRQSFLVQGTITQVSNSHGTIFSFTTSSLPAVEIKVDTITNPQLIIINASVPTSFFEGGKLGSELVIYKDGDMNTPYSPDFLFPDSVFYREPGTTLTFLYNYTYDHSITGESQKFSGQVTIYTPNVLMGIGNEIYRSETIPKMSRLNLLQNTSRLIFFSDISTTLQLNNAPQDGQAFLSTDEFGVPIREPRTSSDAWNYLTVGVNNATYSHRGASYGNLYVYKEDDQYIYARMTQTVSLSSYRKGFLMLSRNQAGEQQSGRELYFKGIVFKVAKK